MHYIPAILQMILQAASRPELASLMARQLKTSQTDEQGAYCSREVL
jgi:hypothetical protein